MALLENNVLVPTKHGRMPAFTACPDGPGSFPAIIFYMDAPGFREELCNMGRRIAKHGYYCIVPDLYYRLGTLRFDLPRRNDVMSTVIRAAMNHLTNQDVYEDTGGILQYLDAQDKVKPGKVGCVGHCMSGRYVTTVAARYPHRFAAAVSLYGVGIVTDQPDSPHLIVDQVQGELYYAFAETDHTVPDNVIPDLTKALDKGKVKYTLEKIPGTEHGFQFAERAPYHPEAAEHVWDKMFELYDRTLR